MGLSTNPCGTPVKRKHPLATVFWVICCELCGKLVNIILPKPLSAGEHVATGVRTAAEWVHWLNMPMHIILGYFNL